jgi:hypothetical protein
VHPYRDKYQRWLVLVVIILAIIVIVGPFLLLGFLCANKARIAARDQALSAKFGVLYEAYGAHAYWFECGTLIRRAAFVALDATLYDNPAERAYSFVILSVLLFVAQIYLVPFAAPRDNLLEAGCLIVLSLVSSTVMLRPDRHYSYSESLALTIWLSVLVILPSAVLFFLVFQRLANQLLGRQTTMSESRHKTGISMTTLPSPQALSSSPSNQAV